MRTLADASQPRVVTGSVCETPLAAVSRTVVTWAAGRSVGRSNFSRRLESSKLQGRSLLPVRDPTVTVTVSFRVA